MATTNISENRSYGAAVLERLDDITVPVTIRPYVSAFRKAHDEYDAAAAQADEAREKRDAALDAAGDADDTFDDSANTLADKIVGAGLGKRQNPFTGFSKHSPSELTALPYAKEPTAARELVTAILKKKPPSDVAKASTKLLKDAAALQASLAKLTKPQAAFTKAMTARDALLPAWTKALRKLKKHAAAAWDDDEGTYKAIFAPATAIQAPKKRQGKAKPNGAPARGASPR